MNVSAVELKDRVITRKRVKTKTNEDMDSVKDIMNSFNSELNSVLNVLKTTKMSETKVKSIEKSLNAMKDMFETEVKQRSDEKRDNQKNRDKRVKTNQEIEDR